MTTMPTIPATPLGYLQNAVGYDAWLQEANWEQEMLAGTNAQKISPRAPAESPMSGRNWLCNGGFELWNERGISFAASASPISVAPGWRAQNVGVDREVGTTLGSTSVRMTMANTIGAGGCALFQNLDVANIDELRGRAVCLYAWGFGGVIAPFIYDGTTLFAQAYDCSLAWRPMYLYATIGALSSGVQIGFQNAVGLVAQTFYIDDAMFSAYDANVRMPPQQVSMADMFSRQRSAVIPFSARFKAYGASDFRFYNICLPYAPMRGTPTVSLSLVGTAGVDYANVLSPNGLGLYAPGCDARTLVVQLFANAAGDCFVRNQRIALDGGDG